MELANIDKATKIAEQLGIEKDIYLAMKNSIYPGAKDESIAMVWSYCKAKRLDPLIKAVHIVAMDIPTGKKDPQGWDLKERRDIVMPGIPYYRTQAMRTGQYMGHTDPVFGPTIKTTLGKKEVSFPEWCQINVKRLVNGQIVEFPARVRWLESYASAGKDNAAPNAMWFKRPYGQLEKCAEALGLRKAFPEEVGNEPTAEEMEGKHFEWVDDPSNTTVPTKAKDRLNRKTEKVEALPPPDSQVLCDNLITNIDNAHNLEDLKMIANVEMASVAMMLTEDHKKEIKKKYAERKKKLTEIPPEDEKSTMTPEEIKEFFDGKDGGEK